MLSKHLPDARARAMPGGGGIIELFCCQRGRRLWDDKQRQQVELQHQQHNPEAVSLSVPIEEKRVSSPDSFIAGERSERSPPRIQSDSESEDEQVGELVIRVLSAHLSRLASSGGILDFGMDLFVEVELEADDHSHQAIGRTPTHWMSDVTPSWQHEVRTPYMLASGGQLLFQVMVESFGGWGAPWCFGTSSAQIQDFLGQAADDGSYQNGRGSRCDLSVKYCELDGQEFRGKLSVEVFWQPAQSIEQQPSPMLCPATGQPSFGSNHSNSDSDEEVGACQLSDQVQAQLGRTTQATASITQGLNSEGSTTPEVPHRFPRQGKSLACSSSESDTEQDEEVSEQDLTPSSRVADAMMRHWQSKRSNALEELVARLQLEASFMRKGWNVFRPGNAKDPKFFAVIGKQNMLGKKLSKAVQGASRRASMELAWFEGKQAWLEHKAPLGSLTFDKIQGCSAGAPDGDLYKGMDGACRNSLVIICFLGPSGADQIEILCNSPESAEQWSRDLQEILYRARGRM